MDQTSGDPVPDATVQLSGTSAGSSPRVARTDAKGRFAFVGVAAGRVSLAALPSVDYGGGSLGQRRPGGIGWSLVVDGISPAGPITVPVWRTSAISGTVRTTSGEPAIGSVVKVFRRLERGSSPQLTLASVATTDTEGSFRAFGLGPGEYVVSISDFINSLPGAADRARMPGVEGGMADPVPGSRMQATPIIGRPDGRAVSFTGAGLSKKVLIDSRFYFASGRTNNDATILTLTPGQSVGQVDLIVEAALGWRVSGTVLSQDGLAVGGIRLLAVPTHDEHVGTGDELAVASTITDRNGAFVFPAVPAGPLTIRTNTGVRRGLNTDTWLATSDAERIGRTETTVGNADIDGLTVTIRKPARIRGRISFDGTAARPSGERMAQTAISVEPVRGPWRDRDGTTAGGRIFANGSFLTAGVEPNDYFLRVPVPPPGWMVAAIRLAGRDTTETPIAVSGSDVADVEIVFSDRPGVISGTVSTTAGSRDRDATVIVFAADSRRWALIGATPTLVREVRVSETGAFNVQGLPAGDYFIVAIDDSIVVVPPSHRFLERLRPYSSQITLAGGTRLANLTTAAVGK